MLLMYIGVINFIQKAVFISSFIPHYHLPGVYIRGYLLTLKALLVSAFFLNSIAKIDDTALYKVYHFSITT